MMRNAGLTSLAICAAFLTACASNPNASRYSGPSGFADAADGAVRHNGTGLVCPSELNGVPRDGTREYGASGLDASCSYISEEGATTIFLTKNRDSFEGNFAGAARAIVLGGIVEGMDINEDATKACRLGGLIQAASNRLEEGAPSSKSRVYPFETLIYSGSGKRSVLALSEIDGKFLKLRRTEQDIEPELITASYVPIPTQDTEQDEDLIFCLTSAAILREVFLLTAASL